MCNGLPGKMSSHGKHEQRCGQYNTDPKPAGHVDQSGLTSSPAETVRALEPFRKWDSFPVCPARSCGCIGQTYSLCLGLLHFDWL